MSTAFTLVVSSSSYSVVFAAQHESTKEESVASSSVHSRQQSMDQRLQELEDQRDLTDFRDYPRFKDLTHEISSMIGAFPAEGALPKGEELHRWIDSIIRTRHKFSGQACLGKHGMANRYVHGLRDLDNHEHRNHIAVIMAIDAMVKLAIMDEDFSAMWSAQTLGGTVADEFIEKVLETLNAGQFGWPKKKINASLPVKVDSHSDATDSSQKAVKFATGYADIVLGSVVKDIFDYHNQRCDVLNTPLNEVFVDGAVQTKTDIIDQKTQLINVILRDRERVDVKRHASEDEKKAILQAVMGAEISTHAYQDVKREALSLAAQLPTGLTATDPRFKHFEILCLAEELSRNLVKHVKEHGYDALHGVTLNGIVGNTYADLFAYSGLEEEIFFDWFKEVLESHKAGFVASIKRFEVDDLADGVRAILTKRPDIVRLAGDIFQLHAPKLDLQTVYVEMMASGGEWRDWTVEQIGSFAHVINLTDVENRENPERVREYLYLNEQNEVSLAHIQTSPSLETQLRTEFKESLATKRQELYSTSVKGHLISEEASRVQVTYIYDPCLPYRGLGVVGKGQVTFNLTRNIKPDLKHLLAKKESLSADYITELYASTLAEPSLEMYDFWYKKGMAHQVYLFGKYFNARSFNVFISDAYDPLRALDFFREAIDLGSKEAINDLSDVIDNCTRWSLISTTDVNKAISFFQEALFLGSNQAKENLIGGAKRLIHGLGVERDMAGALVLLEELSEENDVDDVIRALNHCGHLFFNGSFSSEKNNKLANECFEAAIKIKGWNKRGKYRDDFHHTLIDYSKKLMQGCDIERDILKSLFILHKIATEVEYLKSDAASVLINFGASFCKGTDGLEKNIDIAMLLFQKALEFGDKRANNNLAACAQELILEESEKRDIAKALVILEGLCDHDESMFDSVHCALNYCGKVFFNGGNGVEKNTKLAIECLESAMKLKGWNEKGHHRDLLHANLIECARVLIAGKEIQSDIPRGIAIFHRLGAEVSHLKSDAASKLNEYGMIFFTGINGFEQNMEYARLCLNEAAQLGNCTAARSLEVLGKFVTTQKSRGGF